MASMALNTLNSESIVKYVLSATISSMIAVSEEKRFNIRPTECCVCLCLCLCVCVCVYECVCMYFHHKLIEILDALLGLVLTEGSGVEEAHGGVENAL